LNRLKCIGHQAAIAGKPAPTEKPICFWSGFWCWSQAPRRTTLAERRLESVGNPAGRRVSRPGPGMAHDGGPRIQAGV